jgi:hypothetical protein
MTLEKVIIVKEMDLKVLERIGHENSKFTLSVGSRRLPDRL